MCIKMNENKCCKCKKEIKHNMGINLCLKCLRVKK